MPDTDSLLDSLASDAFKKVPQPTIERLSAYLQCVRGLRDEERATASSAEIARRTGINAAQLRKDLSYFGEFGTPGLGYDLRALERQLAHIMGLDEERDVLLIGAGNLGRALSSYTGFARRGFRIVAAFDLDAEKVGTPIGNIPVFHLQELSRRNAEFGAQVGLVAVPSNAAQEAVDALVAAGVKAILNFAPATIGVRPGITIRNVDLTSQMEILSFYLRHG
ncbi:redox-sensing transcriptional repressor Rex [Abditibacteriota bacterium]|nr:redox-sensing transcriptional repressor Rex [Abditibacteriota bacterium]